MIIWLSIPIPVPTLEALMIYVAFGYITVAWLLLNPLVQQEMKRATKGDQAFVYAAFFLTWPVLWIRCAPTVSRWAWRSFRRAKQ